MKQYTIIILLIILVTSCAPQTGEPTPVPPAEEPQEIVREEPPAEEPQEITTQEPEIEESPEENTIEIKEDSFYPKEKTIEIDTEIKWIKKDKRLYKIACYLEGNRVTLSPDLKEGDSFTYMFLKEGEYTCITSPYGLRNVIKVGPKQALLSPTGNVALEGGTKSIKGASLAAIALIAMMLLLFFSHGKKKKITRNF